MTMITIAIIATTAIIMIVLSETAPATNIVVNLPFSMCSWLNLKGGPPYLADALQPVARIPGRQRLRPSSTSTWMFRQHDCPLLATERSCRRCTNTEQLAN